MKTASLSRFPGASLPTCAVVLAACCFGVAAPAAAPASSPAAPAKLNILWLIGDDLGAELGCYGDPAARTPNADRLAAAGVRYTRFYTTAPVCSASRSAFMTGMFARTLRAENHRTAAADKQPLPEGVRLLTDWFRAAGYYTANLVEFPAALGFKGTGKTDWNFVHQGPPFDTNRWTDLAAHQPFFAQVNFQEPHRKFRAPPQTDPAKVVLPPYYPDTPEARADWAAYLDSVSEFDRKAGLVLRQLETDGLADNTLVVLFGDNGRCHVRDKQFCYEEGLRVPLLVRWPKNFPAPAGSSPGTVNDRLLTAIDLAPTMLALAGAPVPGKMPGHVFAGPRAAAPRAYAFGARDRCDETVLHIRTVRDARYRYILNLEPDVPLLAPNKYKETQYPVWNQIKQLAAAGQLTPAQAALYGPRRPAEELYDLAADPHEIRNLAASAAPEHQAVLKKLRSALDTWLRETNPPELRSAVAGDKPDASKIKPSPTPK